MKKQISKNTNRQRRHFRIRKIVKGTADRPRLSVFRSNKAIYVQLIDDVNQNTLLSANTKELNLTHANIESATALGKLVGEKALKQGIEKVVFDRGGYLYHGRVKALAEAARAAGLQF